jgi:hypothetical protein
MLLTLPLTNQQLKQFSNKHAAHIKPAAKTDFLINMLLMLPLTNQQLKQFF